VNIQLSFSSLSLFGYDNGYIGLGLESYIYYKEVSSRTAPYG